MASRRPSLSAWSAVLAAWFLVLILDVSGVWHPGDWVYLATWAAYALALLWPYRPAAWRVTDDRRPSWAKKDDDH